MGMFPASYNIDELSPKGSRGLAPLDHNHTHFILVDNGTEKKFGGEIIFRATLEHYISEMMETGIAKNQSEFYLIYFYIFRPATPAFKTFKSL